MIELTKGEMSLMGFNLLMIYIFFFVAQLQKLEPFIYSLFNMLGFVMGLITLIIILDIDLNFLHKKTIFLLIFLISISSVQALPELRITPTTINIDIYKNQARNYSMELANYGDEDMSYISFTNLTYFTFPKIYNLSKANFTTLNLTNLTTNETYLMNITTPTKTNVSFRILTTDAFTTTYISTARFFYYSLVEVENINRTVFVDNSGFSNSNITAYKGDIIIIWNMGSEIHTVTDEDLTFDHELEPDEKIALNCTEIKAYTIFDKETGYTAKIHITNNTIETLTHSSPLDKTLTLNVNSRAEQSNVSMDIFIKEFQMKYNDIAQGVVRILNDQNVTALNITLEMDWVNFTENNFDLTAYNSKLVMFSITPDNITQSSQTGKQYKLFLKVSGENFDAVTETITVNIEYDDFVARANGSIIYLIDKEKIAEICRLNPEICPTTEVEKIELVEIEKYYNISGSNLGKWIDLSKKAYDMGIEREGEQDEFEEQTLGHVQDINIKVDAVEVELGKFGHLLNDTVSQVNKTSTETRNMVSSYFEGKGKWKSIVPICMLVILVTGVSIKEIRTYLIERKKKKAKYNAF